MGKLRFSGIKHIKYLLSDKFFSSIWQLIEQVTSFTTLDRKPRFVPCMTELPGFLSGRRASAPGTSVCLLARGRPAAPRASDDSVPPVTACGRPWCLPSHPKPYPRRLCGRRQVEGPPGEWRGAGPVVLLFWQASAFSGQALPGLPRGPPRLPVPTQLHSAWLCAPLSHCWCPQHPSLTVCFQ